MTDDPSPDFTAAAGRLYAVAPAEFVSSRDDEVRRARDEGRHDDARALGKLRRPNQSAWLVNALVRERRDTIEELLALGEEFRAAYERGSGERVREVSAQRQRLVTKLVRDARGLGESADIRMTPESSRDVEGTLDAAIVDPDVAADLRQGRLTAPVPPAGFVPTWEPPRDAKRAPASAGRKGSRGVPDDETRSKQATGRRGREVDDDSRSERRWEIAQGAVTEAERDLDTREKALQSATRRRDRVRDELDRLRDRVRDTEERLTALERDVRAEGKRRQRAADALAAAQRDLDRKGRRQPRG